MAKGLKTGDAVMVRKETKVGRKTEAGKRGRKRIAPGELGYIVGPAGGRSMIVAFGKHRLTLSSQRLDRAAAVHPGGDGPQQTQPDSGNAPTFIDYRHPRFVTEVANRLLMSGTLNPEPASVVLEVRLGDLPEEIQQQVHALIEAKLSLGPSSTSRRA